LYGILKLNGKPMLGVESPAGRDQHPQQHVGCHRRRQVFQAVVASRVMSRASCTRFLVARFPGARRSLYSVTGLRLRRLFLHTGTVYLIQAGRLMRCPLRGYLSLGLVNGQLRKRNNPAFLIADAHAGLLDQASYLEVRGCALAAHSGVDQVVQ